MIAVRYTENFTSNLQDIETFWDGNQHPAGLDQLLAELTDPVIPNLMRHPRMGRNFLARKPQSVDTLARAQKIGALLQTLGTGPNAAEVREYVMNDYLLLYLLSGKTIHLLAIKHHKQLAFDFRAADE